MRTQSELQKTAAAEVPIADYIPFGSHVREDVVKLRGNGEYIAIWRLDGITWETRDEGELNRLKEGLNNFLHALGGGRFAIWTHKIRRRISDRLASTFTNDFCAGFDERYYARFEGERLMVTELYLTLVYRPPATRVGRLFRQVKVRSLDEIQAQERDCLDVLDDGAKQVESSLAKYGPERLGMFEKNEVAHSAMATFLGYLVNGVWEDIPLRRARLNEYLPTSRLHFGDRNGMLQIEHPSARRFVGFLDFQEYPQWAKTGMNNSLLSGGYEFIETQSFSMLNKRDALSALGRQKNQLIAGEEGSATEIAEMDVAIDQVRRGEIEMGEYHYTLAVFGESVDDVADKMSLARAAFEEPGFKMATVDAIPECAWFAQLPGNWSLRPREASITSYNFACLSPFHNFVAGKRTGNPWGDAVTMVRTPNGRPFFVNFHAGRPDEDDTDKKIPGNTFVCGATGEGKTAAVSMLLAQADKFNPRMVFFDKDRGSEILIRAMGGRYRTFKRGERTGINPFQWTDTPATRALCKRLVLQCVRMEGKPISAQEESLIDAAIKTVFDLPFEMRRLAAVDQNLPNVGDNSLRLRLKKWVGTGTLSWVMDNPRDTLDLEESRKFGFDYTEFLDDPEVRTVVMMPLLHAMQGLITGEPFIFCMEEFWKPLMDDVFADLAKNKIKTIRKESGLGIFVTQSPGDVVEHAIGKTVVEGCITQIYLPNPRADRNDYVDGFKVTPKEFETIAGFREGSRQALIKQGDNSTVVSFNLAGLDDDLVMLSGSTDNVELLDEIRAEVGDDPAAWRPILLRRVAERRAAARSGRI